MNTLVGQTPSGSPSPAGTAIERWHLLCPAVSIDAAVRSHETAPDDDVYAESGWEETVTSIDPDRDHDQERSESGNETDTADEAAEIIGRLANGRVCRVSPIVYEHGHVVSIPDPHETRPSRPAVIISDEDCPDHGSLYTVAAVAGSQRDGQTRYAVEIASDEPETGGLLKRSSIEPWATEQIAHDDIRDVHARLGPATMKRLVRAYAEMVLRGEFLLIAFPIRSWIAIF